MSQMARGLLSFLMKSSIEEEPVAPSLASDCDDSVLLLQRFLNRGVESLQIFRDVFTEMDAQRAATTFGEHGEITASLGRFHDTERVLLAWHFDIDRGIA